MLSVQTHIAVVNTDGVEPPMHIVEQDVNQVPAQAVSVSLFVVSLSRGTILVVDTFLVANGLNFFML